MKKIFITFFTLPFFVLILLLPAILWLHASMMPEHTMNAGDCIEHCMGDKAYTNIPKVVSPLLWLDLILIKVVFVKVFIFLVPLFLIYILLSSAPPNLYKKIKNYNYSSLIGIIKLTT